MNATNNSSCCTPATSRTAGEEKEALLKPDSTDENAEVASGELDFLALQIPGGGALTDTDQPMIPLDEESPCRQKHLEPFRMMQTAVTNELFETFVIAMDYVTEAERYGWSFVFQHNESNSFDKSDTVPGSPWWRKTCAGRILTSCSNWSLKKPMTV